MRVWWRWHLHHAVWMRTRAHRDEELIHWLSLPTGPAHSPAPPLQNFIHPLLLSCLHSTSLSHKTDLETGKFLLSKTFVLSCVAAKALIYRSTFSCYHVIFYHWLMLARNAWEVIVSVSVSVRHLNCYPVVSTPFLLCLTLPPSLPCHLQHLQSFCSAVQFPSKTTVIFSVCTLKCLNSEAERMWVQVVVLLKDTCVLEDSLQTWLARIEPSAPCQNWVFP